MSPATAPAPVSPPISEYELIELETFLARVFDPEDDDTESENEPYSASYSDPRSQRCIALINRLITIARSGAAS